MAGGEASAHRIRSQPKQHPSQPSPPQVAARCQRFIRPFPAAPGPGLTTTPARGSQMCTSTGLSNVTCGSQPSSGFCWGSNSPWMGVRVTVDNILWQCPHCQFISYSIPGTEVWQSWQGLHLSNPTNTCSLKCIEVQLESRSEDIRKNLFKRKYFRFSLI